jgi:Fur family ferric uptake transcriptional regulator
MDRRALIDEFRAYLKANELPVTPQRVAVAEVLLLRDRHYSAEEIGRELEKDGVKVGTATIYRSIEVLVRSGLVVERDFGEGFRRF